MGDREGRMGDREGRQAVHVVERVPEGLLEFPEQFVHLLVVDDQRRAEGQRVPQVAQNQAVLQRPRQAVQADAGRCREAFLGVLVGDQLDGTNQADASYVAYQGMVFEGT